MLFHQYLELTENIVNKIVTTEPYNDEAIYNYVKLNASRMNRWLKTFTPSENIKKKIESINQHQEWIIITEPWCGDAAHIVPIIFKLSELNTNIHLNINLRDGNDSLIDNYLTNGSKAMPKLVIRNQTGEDLAVWGPRPQEAQQLFLDLKAQEVPVEDVKIALQKWYNQDKAISICNEIVALLNL
ncbi:MAG: thioredoxin family protein [Chitinophagales bacterium]|nr:thioredoxin family protein [Chitinophagales bacterium]